MVFARPRAKNEIILTRVADMHYGVVGMGYLTQVARLLVTAASHPYIYALFSLFTIYK